jgi:DNA-binding MarR family transcriptional regulator
MEEFKLKKTLGALVSRTNLLLRNYFSYMAKGDNLEATVEQMIILTFVSRHPGVSQSELAELSHKDRTSITRILDVLEKKAYLDRRPDARDRRAYRIYLTPTGEETLPRLLHIAAQVNQLSCADFTPEEIELLKTLLNRVCTNINRATGR